MTKINSIFRKYYSEVSFTDRFIASPGSAVDVIIPVVHTNELWEPNLKSIYREIPVNRLLISDGGCIDDSIKIVKKFPRVEVYDHRKYISLGYCLKKLIEAVETEWFVYLHSDVYLPEGWFDTMKKYQGEYDWFGCPMRITAMIDYHNVDKMASEIRPYAGSQMGRKKVFMKGIKKIDDDFVYRQEDYVLAHIVETDGFRHGRIEDTFHYHQVMHKESPWERKLKSVSVEVEWSQEESVRASIMQIKGIVKYLYPTNTLKKELESHIQKLINLGEFNKAELRRWVEETNPIWKPHVNYNKIELINLLRRVEYKIKGIVKKRMH